MKPRTLVLRHNANQDDLASLADELGWRLAGEDERTHWLLRSKWWLCPDATRVTYSEDHTSDVRFVEVEGPNAAVVSSRIQQTLPHHTLEDMLDSANSDDPRALIMTLGRLAAVRPQEPDERFVEVWQRSAHHNERTVRRAACRTAYNLPWPQIEALASERSDNDVRLHDAWTDLLGYLSGDAEDGR